MFYLQSRFQMKPFSLNLTPNEMRNVYPSRLHLYPQFRSRNHALQHAGIPIFFYRIQIVVASRSLAAIDLRCSKFVYPTKFHSYIYTRLYRYKLCELHIAGLCVIVFVLPASSASFFR